MAHSKQNELGPEEALAKAKKDALRLLSFRPRSTEELRSRLLRKKHSVALVEEILVYCQAQGLLDDEKFAKLYALSRIQSRPSGKRVIARDLQNKGIPPAVVNRAIGSIEDFDEKKVALDMALRRHQRMNRLPENVSKMRLYGFLKRRGFDSESVYYALSKLYKRVEPMESGE